MADQNDGGAPGLNYTGFPNGIKITGYGSALYPVLHGQDRVVAVGTIVVPSGAAGTAFGPTVGGQPLGSAIFVSVSPYGDLGAGAGFAGAFAAVNAGGSVTILGISGAGTASTAAGTVTYQVWGTY